MTLHSIEPAVVETKPGSPIVLPHEDNGRYMPWAAGWLNYILLQHIPQETVDFCLPAWGDSTNRLCPLSMNSMLQLGFCVQEQPPNFQRYISRPTEFGEEAKSLILRQVSATVQAIFQSSWHFFADACCKQGQWLCRPLFQCSQQQHKWSSASPTLQSWCQHAV